MILPKCQTEKRRRIGHCRGKKEICEAAKRREGERNEHRVSQLEVVTITE